MLDMNKNSQMSKVSSLALVCSALVYTSCDVTNSEEVELSSQNISSSQVGSSESHNQLKVPSSFLVPAYLNGPIKSIQEKTVCIDHIDGMKYCEMAFRSNTETKVVSNFDVKGRLVSIYYHGEELEVQFGTLNNYSDGQLLQSTQFSGGETLETSTYRNDKYFSFYSEKELQIKFETPYDTTFQLVYENNDTLLTKELLTDKILTLDVSNQENKRVEYSKFLVKDGYFEKAHSYTLYNDSLVDTLELVNPLIHPTEKLNSDILFFNPDSLNNFQNEEIKDYLAGSKEHATTIKKEYVFTYWD